MLFIENWTHIEVYGALVLQHHIIHEHTAYLITCFYIWCLFPNGLILTGQLFSIDCCGALRSRHKTNCLASTIQRDGDVICGIDGGGSCIGNSISEFAFTSIDCSRFPHRFFSLFEENIHMTSAGWLRSRTSTIEENQKMSAIYLFVFLHEKLKPWFSICFRWKRWAFPSSYRQGIPWWAVMNAHHVSSGVCNLKSSNKSDWASI